jgi:chorismate synthase
MAGNSFGTIFRITTFGESHGVALGVVIDGCPPGIAVDEQMILAELARRKPGQSSLTTSRLEDESVEILSGIFEEKTTGTPIAIMVRNKDQRSSDYDALKNVYRPSHADYTYEQKYGVRDHRGGGRSSARETVARVVAGVIAKQVLAHSNITVTAYVSQVADIKVIKPYTELDLTRTEQSIVRCPDEPAAAEMIARIEQVKQEGDSVGGTITCVVKGTPAGLGEPVFDKLHADLAKAMLSINACKGFDLGSGFDSITMKGSEHNDAFVSANGKISTLTNHSGGIQGGITNGEDIYFRCAFKPVSTISKPQQTINTEIHTVTMEAAGRHDPCVLPRAVPIVEAMAALVLADHLLRNHIYVTLPAQLNE